MKNQRYFNFPINLLEGFLMDSMKCLNDIVNYAIYDYCSNLDDRDYEEKLDDCENFFGISLVDRNNLFRNGKRLFEKNNSRVKVGLNVSIFMDFAHNYKSEFEKICLLGFLAIKSILQQKAYCKIDNKFWFARMSGLSKSCNFCDLPENIKKYTNPYQARKIKSGLVDNWSLVTYSLYTRGFYVSFKLSLEELVFQAESRRKSRLKKQKEMRERLAVKNALVRLERMEKP